MTEDREPSDEAQAWLESHDDYEVYPNAGKVDVLGESDSSLNYYDLGLSLDSQNSFSKTMNINDRDKFFASENYYEVSEDKYYEGERNSVVSYVVVDGEGDVIDAICGEEYDGLKLGEDLFDVLSWNMDMREVGTWSNFDEHDPLVVVNAMEDHRELPELDDIL